jgi:hypothetical protein
LLDDLEGMCAGIDKAWTTAHFFGNHAVHGQADKNVSTPPPYFGS